MVPLIHSRPSVFSYATLQVVLILILWTPRATHAEHWDQDMEFCPVGASVDLTYASANVSGFLTESGLFFPRKAARYRAGVWRGCICDLKPCLALCPLRNSTGTRRTDVDDDFVNHLAIPPVYTDNQGETPSPEQRFHFVVWDPCQGGVAYFLEPEVHKNDKFHLLENGSLFRPLWPKPETRMLGLKDYCLRLRDNDSIYTPRVCFPKVEEDKFASAKYVGALVAVPFLIATVIVYSVLPELRNIHGTTLRCYLCCLVVTYVALAADRIPPPDFEAGAWCLFLGFTIYFSFLASFFWLNAMCFDMWWRLGGFGTLRSSGKKHDRKKFIGYSLYAWGCALLLTGICIGMEFFPGIPDSIIRPGFRFKACWFATKKAAAIYFFGPIGLIIACNICLFVSTSVKIVRHKKDTQRQLNTGDSKRHDDNKQWFSLYLKLSVVMGITWSTEVISWLWEDPKYLWYVTDMVNALQGFIIFVIFVWKKSIWKSLKKRYKELQFTRQGCIFASLSSDSPATTASSDDSTNRCNISSLAMEAMRNPNRRNTNQANSAHR